MWYAVALVVLAPFLAESVASANTPAVLLPILLPYYAVVYGLPALLFRELWVRSRLTPALLVVYGIGYTAFNEGVVAATWFKLSPGSARVLAFSAEQAGHWAGVNWPVALNLVVFHTVYSLMAPVILVQALAARRGRGAEGRPWVGRWGAIWCTVPVVIVLLGALTPRATAETCAGPALRTCAAGRWAAAVLVVMAGAVALIAAVSRRADAVRPWYPAPPPGRRPHPSGATWQPGPPPPWSWVPPGGAPPPPPPPQPPGPPPPPPPPRGVQVQPPRAAPRVLAGCGFALAFFVTFFALPLLGLPVAAVVAGLGLLGLVIAVAAPWCRKSGYVSRSDLYVLTGALLPGMLLSLNAWRVGQPLAAIGGGVLLWLALRRPPPASGLPGGRT